MNLADDYSQQPDESFGPGTDLVVSLLAVLLLILIQLLNAQNLHSFEEQKGPQQILVIEENYDEKPLFEKDKSTLTPHARLQLRRSRSAFVDALESNCCNQILIEGHASPDAPSSLSASERERWNLSLSIDRSLAVIDYLYSLGIPYECMSLAGFGRSHSQVLGSWLGRDDQRNIHMWDISSAEFVKRVDQHALASERLVRISGIKHERSVCQISG